MRPADLPPAEKLAANKPHGHKIRYMAGCRCWRCRKGSAAYERQLEENRKQFGPNHLVPVDRARTFLREMQQLGIGYMTIAKHIHAAKTCMGEILWPGKSGRRHIRRRTEAKILSYRPTLDTMPLGLEVPSGETFGRVRQLIAWGYPKALIARDALHVKGPSLQIGRGNHEVVEVLTAKSIRDFVVRVIEAREKWVARHGPIPRRHYVYWSGRRLVLRQFHANYDYQHLYSTELKEAIRAANTLKRTIRRKRKDG